MAYSFDSGYKHSLIMKIKNKTGVYIRSISEYNNEREILLTEDRKYKLLSESVEKNGTWYVELEGITYI